MKKNIQALLITVAVLLLSSLLVSLVLTFLFFFQIFVVSTIQIIRLVFSFLIFVVSGFLLGRLIKERTFFYALGLAIVGIGLSLLFKRNFFQLTLCCSKWFLFLVGSLISKTI